MQPGRRSCYAAAARSASATTSATSLPSARCAPRRGSKAWRTTTARRPSPRSRGCPGGQSRETVEEVVELAAHDRAVGTSFHILPQRAFRLTGDLRRRRLPRRPDVPAAVSLRIASKLNTSSRNDTRRARYVPAWTGPAVRLGARSPAGRTTAGRGRSAPSGDPVEEAGSASVAHVVFAVPYPESAFKRSGDATLVRVTKRLETQPWPRLLGASGASSPRVSCSRRQPGSYIQRNNSAW